MGLFVCVHACVCVCVHAFVCASGSQRREICILKCEGKRVSAQEWVCCVHVKERTDESVKK